MFGETTAFRHFGCHGAIYRRKRLHKPIFKCATYWEWSEDLLDLVKDPALKVPVSSDDNLTPVPDLSRD